MKIWLYYSYILISDGLLYARNHLQHTSTHEFCIPLDHCSKDMGIKHETPVARRHFQMPEIPPPLLVLPSPMFSVAFENHIFSHFPCIRALFLSPPAVPGF